MFQTVTTKTTIATLFLAGGASAFTATSPSSAKVIYDPLGLYPATSPEKQLGIIQPIEPPITTDNKPILDPMRLYPEGSKVDSTLSADMSESLPFLPRPKVLKGELAGDVGFDPMGFASSEEKLLELRDAELKHARIAMLAAAGWPLSELLDKELAHLLHLRPVLGFGDKVPSLLNGGLTKVSPIFWGLVLAYAAGWELYQNNKNLKPEGMPGDFGFDPLGLLKTPEDRKWMELAEIKNGRLAMVAVVGFCIQEAVTKIGVVNQTPFFFHPLNEYIASIQEAATAGLN